MTNAQFWVVVTVPSGVILVGIIVNQRVRGELLVRLDRFEERLMARMDRFDARQSKTLSDIETKTGREPKAE